MLKNRFFKYVSKGVEEGQQYFSSNLKLMVQSVAKELFDRLDDENNAVFLNPMLFAFLNFEEGEISLDQILYGSIAPEKRPACIEVLSNTKGEIYLPALGCLKLAVHQEQKCQLLTKNGRIEVCSREKLIPITLKTNPIIPHTNIEVQCIPNPFTNNLIGNYIPGLEAFCADQDNLEALNKAVSILREYYPEFYNLFCLVTRWIMPFSNSASNSFASLAMHGVCFINTHNGDGVVFLIEDIVHQCGHIIFSALTYKPQEYFSIDPETPVRRFTNDTKDDRTLYVLFHGVFTEGLMCEAFDICLKNKLFKGQEEHEVKGRFSFILLRFLLDMEILNKNNHFSKAGQRIYDELYKNMLDKYKRYAFLLTTYNLANQTYNFDYSKFALKNELI